MESFHMKRFWETIHRYQDRGLVSIGRSLSKKNFRVIELHGLTKAQMEMRSKSPDFKNEAKLMDDIKAGIQMMGEKLTAEDLATIKNCLEHHAKDVKRKLEQENGLKPRVINMSGTPLPQEVEADLSLSANYSFGISRASWEPEVFCAEVVSLVESLVPVCQPYITSKIIRSLKNVSDYHTTIPQDGALRVTREFLKRNQGCLILPADKGGAVVVMTKDQYHRGVMSLLEDDRAYKEIEEPDKRGLCMDSHHYHSYLGSLQLAARSPSAKSQLENTSWSRFYALAKVHKTPVKWRPIVSMINSPGRKLADALTTILNGLDAVTHLMHVTNVYELKKEIDAVQVKNGEVLFSADAISMFTCISVELVMRSLMVRSNAITNKGISMPMMAAMMQLLLTKCAVFVYRGVFYRQVGGLAVRP